MTARNKSTPEEMARVANYTITPRATGNNVVISATSHRLVALYSAPPCPAGDHMRVRFSAGSGPIGSTPWKACVAGLSRNFLVAGLRASTQYEMFHEIATDSGSSTSPPISFTSGALPLWLPFPSFSWLDPPDVNSCLWEGVVLHSHVAFAPDQITVPVATDLLGRIIWYYTRFANIEQNGTMIFRPRPGGTMMLAANDPTSELGFQQLLREIDLEGNPLRETNVDRVSEQLVAMGHDPITSFHHESIGLPNGNLITLASVERLLTDVQGPGIVAVIADMLVELDEDLQVVWAWNGFDHLDVTRVATLGETCVNDQPGCPPVVLDDIANDWMHSNSVHYTPQDGNLILSMRHQDWVIKIDFSNGTGSGAVLWRLGQDGDFTVFSADPDPWFSHQHDAEYDIPGLPLMSIFDNGNVRREQDPEANSRGQVFWLDETNLAAFPVMNADLGSYSLALGSAERLCNWNYHFDSGFLLPDGRAQAVEVRLNGSINFVLESTNTAYRSFRMYSLYQP